MIERIIGWLFGVAFVFGSWALVSVAFAIAVLGAVGLEDIIREMLP